MVVAALVVIVVVEVVVFFVVPFAPHHELGYELVKQVASSLGSALMRHECGSWTFTASPNHLTGYADGYAD